VIGDQDMLAEQVLFQGGAGAGADAQVSRRCRSLGWLPSSCQVTTRRTQGSPVIAAISASTLPRGRRVLPRARVAASSSSFGPAFASVVPSNPRAWLSCSSGEWVRMVRRCVP